MRYSFVMARKIKYDKVQWDTSKEMDELTTGDMLTEAPIETLVEDLDLFRQWFPVLKELGDPKNLSAEDIVSRVTPLATVVLTKLMMTAKSEKVKATCAKELAYMGGMKPVEKSQNINVNVMARKEATRLLESELERFGIELVDEDNENSH